MKFQAVQFVREAPKSGLKAHAKWEHGIAKVKAYNEYDIVFIIDKLGNKLAREDVDSYRLKAGPLSYINTEYPACVKDM